MNVNQDMRLFFQDFTENMQSHRDNKNYLKWNLEDTARIIQAGFLDAHVVVVRPSRYIHTFENTNISLPISAISSTR